MSKVYFNLTVQPDGTITLPAFGARGLGLKPGDTTKIGIPTTPAECESECDCHELFLAPCCGDVMCSGYTTDSEDLNIPAWMMAEAGIPGGADITVFAGDKVLVLAAGADELADLPEAIAELLEELGITAGHMKVLPLNGCF